MKVFLIGYMGVGKSTIGKRLASSLDLAFIDIDRQIEESTGGSIAQLFAEKGEVHFREMEAQVLQHVAKSEVSAVVSTGGGAPCYADNMDIMLTNGVVVWLQLPIKTIVHRLESSKSERPLIAGLKSEELPDFIETHLAERTPWYSRGHIEFDTRDANASRITELVDKIQAHWEARPSAD